MTTPSVRISVPFFSVYFSRGTQNPKQGEKGTILDGRNPAPLWKNKSIFVGIHREIIILVFLRRCEMDSVHPR